MSTTDKRMCGGENRITNREIMEKVRKIRKTAEKSGKKSHKRTRCRRGGEGLPARCQGQIWQKIIAFRLYRYKLIERYENRENHCFCISRGFLACFMGETNIIAIYKSSVNTFRGNLNRMWTKIPRKTVPNCVISAIFNLKYSRKRIKSWNEFFDAFDD